MQIKSYWTSEVSHLLEQAIMNCFNKTFSQQKPPSYFQWKFRDNPFGDSLHILVFDDSNLISVRTFWRLDINDQESYQCVDTSVLPSYQGKGIFGYTTRIALNILKGKFIYNYPNELSGPAYLRYGWKEIANSTSIKFNLTSALMKQTPSIDWDLSQLTWRFQSCPISDYFILRKKDSNFLFSKKRNNFYVLLGKISHDLDLSSVDPLFSFTYDSSLEGIVVRKKLPYMAYEAKAELIYYYNFDMS